MCSSCRPHVDVHKKGGGPAHVDRGGGAKIGFFCGRHKWIAPNVPNILINTQFNYSGRFGGRARTGMPRQRKMRSHLRLALDLVKGSTLLHLGYVSSLEAKSAPIKL